MICLLFLQMDLSLPFVETDRWYWWYINIDQKLRARFILPSLCFPIGVLGMSFYSCVFLISWQMSYILFLPIIAPMDPISVHVQVHLAAAALNPDPQTSPLDTPIHFYHCTFISSDVSKMQCLKVHCPLLWPLAIATPPSYAIITLYMAIPLNNIKRPPFLRPWFSQE